MSLKSSNSTLESKFRKVSDDKALPSCLPYPLPRLILKREAGGIVLKIAYGYTINPHSPDPLVDLADKAMEDFSSALLPTAWAVDFIPIRKLP